jgi:integrase
MTVRRDADPARLKPWGVFWHVYREGFKGRPKQKSAWFPTEAEAQRFKRETLALLAQMEDTTPVAGVHTPAPANTLAGFAPIFLEHIEAHREAATHKGYASLLKNHIGPELGGLLLGDKTFTSLVVGQFYKKLHADGMQLGSRRHVHTCLSSLASYAKLCGLLTHNPCLQIGRYIRQRGEENAVPEPNPFTGEEVTAILDQLAACEELWLPYFQFLLDTGVRVGEAAGLKWTAIDLDKLAARIEWSWSPSAKADKRPKTHECRPIDLTDTVVEQLAAWQTVQRVELLRRGVKQSPYVFTNLRGCRRLQDGNMRRVFDRVMEACGIEGHTPHDFRDTFATSHLIEAWDRKLGWVSKQLGHATPLTTATHYYKYRPTASTKGFANDIRRWSK